MFYSYTGSEHQKYICPIGYPPNKCSKFLLLSLKSFVTEKRHGAMQKLFIKKEKSKKRRIKKKKEMKKKWTSVRDI